MVKKGRAAPNPGSGISESEVSDFMKSRPITVRRIAMFLLNRYGGAVDLSDLETRPLGDRIERFLTRSLAAHAIATYAWRDAIDACACVVDGGQDLGIDAIAFDELRKCCWLVQSKFVHGGQGAIAWAELAKFLNGFECLASNSFDHANEKILAKRDEIIRAATEIGGRWV